MIDIHTYDRSYKNVSEWGSGTNIFVTKFRFVHKIRKYIQNYSNIIRFEYV